jgi:hypothetical protein
MSALNFLSSLSIFAPTEIINEETKLKARNPHSAFRNNSGK